MSVAGRVCLALCVAVAGAATIGAQSRMAWDESDGYRDPVCTRTHEWLLAGPPVLGAPFSAEATTVWRPSANIGRPVMRATARYYRDSLGRVRVEQTFVGHDDGPNEIILEPDPTDGWTYVLYPASRTSAHVARRIAEMTAWSGGCDMFVLPMSDIVRIPFAIDPTPADVARFDEEPPLERMIAGLHATGRRFALALPKGATGSGHGERWISPDLKIVLYSRSESSIGVVEYEVTRVSRAEPQADLFEMHEDEYTAMPKGSIIVCGVDPYDEQRSNECKIPLIPN